ncbi:SAM-dependent methyltransferase [Dankookia sp. P2]|uniref:SAM-dependent methyltransferase n=1 Tax=Dankookia sp. P2 TaxID=3423955 RepID=UPI003D66CB17
MASVAWKLRNDPRVVVMERVNARYLDSLAEPPAVLVCDASFIGLGTVLPAPLGLVVPGGWAVALIKHAVRGRAGHRQGRRGAGCQCPSPGLQPGIGVVGRAAGLAGAGVEPSPLLGPEGNREFLIAARKPA